MAEKNSSEGEKDQHKRENQTSAHIPKGVVVAGGDFRGSPLGPHVFHQDMSKREELTVRDLRGAHIGPTIIKVVRGNSTEIMRAYHKPSHPASQEAVDDVVQLTSTIRMFKNRRINEHAMVFYGEDRSEVTGSRPLAIKFIQHREKSEKEAKMLMKLAHHSNVVSIVHADVSYQGPVKFIYIAMELCHKQTLRDYLNDVRNGKIPFDPVKMKCFAKQLIEGIAFMHSNGVLHRDLKPDNILFSQDQTSLKIADFGLGKELKHGRSVTRQSVLGAGTDGYRAPETYNSDVITKKADIFSLGLVVYDMLTLRHPFGEDPDEWNINIKRFEKLDLSHLSTDTDDDARDMIQSMLQKEPKKRPKAEQILKHSFFKDKLEPAIVVYDAISGFLLSYNPSTHIWHETWDIREEMIRQNFSVVALGEQIYVLANDKAFYRLSMTKKTWTPPRIGEALA